MIRASAALALCATFLITQPVRGQAQPAQPVFPSATVVTLSNGVVIAAQSTPDTPLVGAQVFFPAGLAQQPAGQAGVAAVAAAMVLQTKVEGDADLSVLAKRLGAQVTYTIDPQDTRFYIECTASDLPRLLHDLSTVIAAPDSATFATARAAALDTANAAIKDPVLTSYAMIRQVEYQGTGFAHPDAGGAISLGALAASDALAFSGQYRIGAGTVVALAGNVTDAALGAAKAAFAGFSAAAGRKTADQASLTRGHEVVAHRDVASPWIAIGYPAPSQYSADFPAMLVIEALLGRGGDVHTFSFGSDVTPPSDFVGGYYQFEAQPGTFVEFYNGANVDQDLRDLSDGVARLRGGKLPDDLLKRAKQAALGDFLTSVTTLDDQSWLLGRAAASPSGVAFENALPGRIAGVTGADVQRVAQEYLAIQTVAVVLPNGVGQ